MAEYRVTFMGPRGGGRNAMNVFAPRACDAIEEARARQPEMNGRPVDVCRLRGVDEEARRWMRRVTF